MNLLADGRTWLREQRKAWYSDLVTYYQDGTPYGPLLAAQAEDTAEIEDGDIIVETKVADWLIDVSDLPVTPKHGDFITIVDADPGTTTRYFEVSAVGGQPAWRWHGRDRLTYRVHTHLTNETALTPPVGTGLYGRHFGPLYGNHFGGVWDAHTA